jgi:5-methyltetrahydrofolate--homocysteine methyltransferase
VEGASLPALRGRRVSTRGQAQEPESFERSDVSLEVPVPTAPFFGTRVSKGLALADYASWIDERALFMGQWGLRGSRAGGASYEELVETEGRPRLRMWLDRLATEGLLEAAVIHGYFPCHSEGNDIVILDPQTLEECSRFSFPRQRRDRRLCLADYVRPRGDTPDVVAFHIVTMGSRISQAAADLFERNEYREYVELHGLSVQLTEALAEMWHARVREELGIHGSDAVDLAQLLKQEYQGERFSFGYPACPDLENQEILCELLKPERIGVSLSEEFQLHPEQSTSAIIFHHPEAHYFNA